MSTRILVRLWVGVLLPILGCQGGEKLPTVPVTGTVTYKGAPVADVSVSFLSTKQGERAATATTDAQGNFKLQTYMAGSTMVPGAIPGDYGVTLRKRENIIDQYRPTGGVGPDGGKLIEESAKKGPPAVSGGRPGQTGPPPEMMRGRAPDGKSLIPEKYESVTTSGLTATVKPSGNEPFKFELVD